MQDNTYHARVRVVTHRDFCSVTTNTVSITFASDEFSPHGVRMACKDAAIAAYPDTRNEYRLISIDHLPNRPRIS